MKNKAILFIIITGLSAVVSFSSSAYTDQKMKTIDEDSIKDFILAKEQAVFGQMVQWRPFGFY